MLTILKTTSKNIRLDLWAISAKQTDNSMLVLFIVRFSAGFVILEMINNIIKNEIDTTFKKKITS